MSLISDLSLVSSVSLLIILAFINLARELHFDAGTWDLSLIQYTDRNSVQYIIEIFSPFGKVFGENGQFSFVLFLTEALISLSILLASVAGVVPDGNISTSVEGILSTAIVLILSGIWILLPVLVVKEYKHVYNNGIVPASFSIHIFLTLLQFGILSFYIHEIEVPNPINLNNLVVSLFVFSFYFLLLLKNRIFIWMLGNELRKAREPHPSRAS